MCYRGGARDREDITYQCRLGHCGVVRCQRQHGRLKIERTGASGVYFSALSVYNPILYTHDPLSHTAGAKRGLVDD